MFDFDELQLSRPLSATSDADPGDVLSAKSAFRRLGYYETPSYGLTPYRDEQLFDGVRAYQKDMGLSVDGYMLPAGETEQSVNKTLALHRNGQKNDNDEACIEPAIQSWQIPSWDSLRPRRYCPLPREKENEQERDRRCHDQWESDNDRCRGLPSPIARRRCWASSNFRLSLCLHGKKNQELPPLDLGD